MQKPANVSSRIFRHKFSILRQWRLLLNRFPKKTNSWSHLGKYRRLLRPKKQTYLQIYSASVCMFKLFPKTTIKSAKLGNNLMENINMIGNFSLTQLNSFSMKKTTSPSSTHRPRKKAWTKPHQYLMIYSDRQRFSRRFTSQEKPTFQIVHSLQPSPAIRILSVLPRSLQENSQQGRRVTPEGQG